MKKRLKNILALGIIGATMLGFVGCGSKTEAASSTGAAEKEKLVLGFDDTFVPMGFKDEKGEIVGFDIDLAKELSKKIGKEITFQPIDWSMKESELNSGKIDMIWNGYSITDERKEKVAFTKPYLDNRQIIITLADSNVKSKADLKGAKVGAQNQSSAVDAINKEADLVKSFADGKIYTFETNDDALRDLEAKRIDAVVADEILARYYISKKGEEKYKVLSDDFGSETYGVGVRKDDKELLDSINKAFDDMKKDGSAKTISEKWFGEDIFK
ncbi:transporter substrate-binding domain-containing protein [Clostridium bovifaecis]|uniref:Transporter substrate-binding domain-containing protein n=1 Tax=Clostridium bovifaecis TaxID=2184719 RepID=A0A6I6EWN6_9CLOT|nr:transporter substrate-binding domain-containing protein [Clostridium bovifaecis]